MNSWQVEWCGGSETMEDTLARIHQREEAAVKRERTLAYAFSHQVFHYQQLYITLMNSTCSYQLKTYIFIAVEGKLRFKPWAS